MSRDWLDCAQDAQQKLTKLTIRRHHDLMQVDPSPQFLERTFTVRVETNIWKRTNNEAFAKVDRSVAAKDRINPVNYRAPQIQ